MPPPCPCAKGVDTSARRILELYKGGWQGGTAAYLTTLLPALAAQGYEAVYAAEAGDPGLSRLSAVGVETATVASPMAALALARRLGVAIVHSHGVRMNLVGRLAARAADAAQVVTVHSRLAQDYRSPARMAAAWALAGPGLGGARAIVAVSEAIRQDLLARGVAAGRIHVVASGVAPPPPPWTGLALREAFAVPQGSLVVGTVARHHRVKGLDVLVDALARLGADPACPPFVHLFLGDGAEGEALRSRARAAGIADRVRFPGFRADARAIVGALDLFVLPSRAEGFGLAVVEAMAAAVPVVATAAGNLPSLLDGGRLGALVPVDDASAMAAAVAVLLRDPARRAELGALGLARYREAYSAEAMARRTAQVLDRLPGLHSR